MIVSPNLIGIHCINQKLEHVVHDAIEPVTETILAGSTW